MLNPAQKMKPCFRKNEEAEDVCIFEDGMIRVGDDSTSIDATFFLYNKQQSKKQTPAPNYK